MVASLNGVNCAAAHVLDISWRLKWVVSKSAGVWNLQKLVTTCMFMSALFLCIVAQVVRVIVTIRQNFSADLNNADSENGTLMR